jgi:thiol-disulfide isomerase/thioredoxin
MKRYLLLIIAIFMFGFALYTVKAFDSTNTKTTSTSSVTDDSKDTQATSDSTSDQSYNSNSLQNSQNSGTSTYGKAQDFTLVDLEGNEVSLSDFKGKKVFLNFWATWCPPCKDEMPEIEKVYQETKDSDLVILAVEIGEPFDTVKNFIDDNKYGFKVLLDLEQSVSTNYEISAIPTSFFIDDEGNIVSKRVGGMTYDEMKEYINTLN